MKKIAVVSIVSILFLSAPAQAGWQDWLNKAKETLDSSSGGSSVASSVLSNDDVIQGLKSALEKGVGSAVSLLGKENGFMGNPKVRIPVPDGLKPVTDALGKFGQQGLVDDFQETLNQAATAAVPEGRQILVDAVKGMSFEDAKKILSGGDTAATDYFRKVSEARLMEKMQPVIENATSKAGVTSSYKKLTGGLGAMASMIGYEVPDLDKYVSTKALDGLFLMIAEEEKQIRTNPVARTTDILKKVFSN